MSGQLVGVNESEHSICVYDGLVYRTYRVHANDGAFEGVALIMEGPDDPVTLWTTNVLQGGPDAWKRLSEDEEISDVRKITKRDGDKAVGAMVQTSQRRIVFGTQNKTRPLTPDEQKEWMEAMLQIEKEIKAKGGKVNSRTMPTTHEDPTFFFELDATSMNEYGDPERGVREFVADRDGYAIEFPFVMQDADSWIKNVRRHLILDY